MASIDLQGSGMTSARTRDRMVNRLMEQGIRDLNVLDVMRRTPRHIFLDEALAHRAYEDSALPIGHGQTLSHPYTVARMTEALIGGGPLAKVLEVGTGSGFQTAVLAQLVGEVYSVERIKALQDRAKPRFDAMGLHNIHLRHTDGGWGWPEEAGFDAIIVTCAPLGVPQTLIQQLNDGGRMVIPVGGAEQDLLLIVREGDSHTTKILEKVRFVPLLGGTL